MLVGPAERTDNTVERIAATDQLACKVQTGPLIPFRLRSQGIMWSYNVGLTRVLLLPNKMTILALVGLQEGSLWVLFMPVLFVF